MRSISGVEGTDASDVTNDVANDEADERESGGWRARIRERIRRFLVVVVFAAAIMGIATAILLSNARKQLHRSLTLVGEDLMRQYELGEGEVGEEGDGERVFVLNGQEIQVHVGRDPRNVEQLLASMPGECERLDEDGMSHQTCVEEGLSFDALIGVARGESPGLEGLKYRLAIGEDEGGTFYLDLNPKSNFDPQALYGDGEDVEGPEHTDIPRPPGGRRFVSAYERGRPYLASFFSESTLSPRELKEFYRENMDSEIWVETEFPDDPDGFVVFRRRGAPHRFVALTFREGQDEESGTLTAITEAQ